MLQQRGADHTYPLPWPCFLSGVFLECLLSLTANVIDPVGKFKKKKVTKNYSNCKNKKSEQMCLGECLFSMEK